MAGMELDLTDAQVVVAEGDRLAVKIVREGAEKLLFASFDVRKTPILTDIDLGELTAAEVEAVYANQAAVGINPEEVCHHDGGPETYGRPRLCLGGPRAEGGRHTARTGQVSDAWRGASKIVHQVAATEHHQLILSGMAWSGREPAQIADSLREGLQAAGFRATDVFVPSNAFRPFAIALVTFEEGTAASQALALYFSAVNRPRTQIQFGNRVVTGYPSVFVSPVLARSFDYYMQSASIFLSVYEGETAQDLLDHLQARVRDGEISPNDCEILEVTKNRPDSTMVRVIFASASMKDHWVGAGALAGRSVRAPAAAGEQLPDTNTIIVTNLPRVLAGQEDEMLSQMVVQLEEKFGPLHAFGSVDRERKYTLGKKERGDCMPLVYVRLLSDKQFADHFSVRVRGNVRKVDLDVQLVLMGERCSVWATPTREALKLLINAGKKGAHGVKESYSQVLQAVREVQVEVRRGGTQGPAVSDSAVHKVTSLLQGQQARLDKIEQNMTAGNVVLRQTLVSSQQTRTDVRKGFTSMDGQFATAERRSATRHRDLSAIAAGMADLANTLKRHRSDDGETLERGAVRGASPGAESVYQPACTFASE